MNKKIIELCATASLMVGASHGATIEWNAGVGAWETDSNWSGGAAPINFSQDATVEIDGGNSEVVTLSSGANINDLKMGNSGVNGEMNTLTLASGANLHSGVSSLGVTNNATTIGRQYASTVNVLAGASFTAEKRITLGRSANGNTPIVDIADAEPSYLNILGGSVIVTQNGDIDIGNDSASRNSGGGVITIDNGGLLEARLDFFNDNTLFQSYVQLNDGTLIMGGNVDVQAMIDDGELKGDNLSWNYGETNPGKTTVIPEPATLGLIGAFGGTMLFIRRRFLI